MIKAVSDLKEIWDKEIEKVPMKETSRMFLCGYGIGATIVTTYFLNYHSQTPLGGVILIKGSQYRQINIEDFSKDYLMKFYQSPLLVFENVSP